MAKNNNFETGLSRTSEFQTFKFTHITRGVPSQYDGVMDEVFFDVIESGKKVNTAVLRNTPTALKRSEHYGLMSKIYKAENGLHPGVFKHFKYGWRKNNGMYLVVISDTIDAVNDFQ